MWQEQTFGAEQPVCDPVPQVEGAAPPTADLMVMALPNAFQVKVSNASVRLDRSGPSMEPRPARPVGV